MRSKTWNLKRLEKKKVKITDYEQGIWLSLEARLDSFLFENLGENSKPETLKVEMRNFESEMKEKLEKRV